MSSLDKAPLTLLRGVGDKFAQTLSKLGIDNLQDLLFHLPSRYVDRTRIRQIGSLRIHDVALLEVQVLQARIVFGRRRSLSVSVEDNSGTLTLRFFHFNAAQKNQFETGRRLRLFGELRPGPSGAEMYHPEYDFLDSQTKAQEQPNDLTPIYPLTDGVSQPRMRSLTRQALDLLDQHPLTELLPIEKNQRFSVNSLAEALRFVHFPPKDSDQQQLAEGRHPYQQRLAFEELLAHFLVHQSIKSNIQQQPAPAIVEQQASLDKFLAALPFEPTRAQKRCFQEIRKDLAQGLPMLRMVQGDVGSGKTLVAVMATIDVVASGFQVALIAPTEILAEQHLQNFRNWLTPLNIQVDWLVGNLTAKRKQAAYQKLENGETQVAIGTHALLQNAVTFARLGLVIIDEQHRFGVQQRLSLREKSLIDLVPHQLIMTATPIPRTLAMTKYAELDFSVIDELPPGRSPVKTVTIAQTRREDVIARVAEACKQDRQIYWVCPLIEESESLDVANAEQCYEDLKMALPDINISLIHGRLSAADKDARMGAFKSGESRLLVATTVIEVGVDVPNASVMIIENPERLGLSQLHQLRGRVGRGSTESHCILLYGNKLSQHGKERLKVLRETNDGFLIAEKDLEIRGPGEFLGTRQAGDLPFRIADQQRDALLLTEVHTTGKYLLENQADQAEQLILRWFGNRKQLALA